MYKKKPSSMKDGRRNNSHNVEQRKIKLGSFPALLGIPKNLFTFRSGFMYDVSKYNIPKLREHKIQPCPLSLLKMHNHNFVFAFLHTIQSVSIITLYIR